MSQGTLSLSSLFVTEEIFKGEYAQLPYFGRISQFQILEEMSRVP